MASAKMSIESLAYLLKGESPEPCLAASVPGLINKPVVAYRIAALASTTSAREISEMAFAQNMQLVKVIKHYGFDIVFKPGVAATWAGVYRCTKCGHEIGIAKGHVLPPQNHHVHDAKQGDIVWQLVVAAEH